MNHDGDQGGGMIQRLEALEQQVDAQQREIARLSGRASSPPTKSEDSMDRRSLLKTAGLSAVGVAVAGVAAVGGASPASATDGDPILIAHKTTGGQGTVAAATGITTAGFTFTNDATYQPSLPALGVQPPVLNVVSVDEVVGLVLSSQSNGADIRGADYGVMSTGGLASLVLGRTSELGPQSDTREHVAGELWLQVSNNPSLYGARLWFCAHPGTPGDWTQLGAFDAVSSFIPVQDRTYDSRLHDGALAGGQTRVINLGTPLTSKQMYLLNVTVTQTVGRGWLQIYSADLPLPPSTSNINWSSNNQDTANMSLIQPAPDGRLKVTAGGTGSTQFIIDMQAFCL